MRVQTIRYHIKTGRNCKAHFVIAALKTTILNSGRQFFPPSLVLQKHVPSEAARYTAAALYTLGFARKR